MPKETEESKEIGEQSHKSKVLVLLGRGTFITMWNLPELEQEIVRQDSNRQVIDGNYVGGIKLEDISSESCDVVSIYVHGNAMVTQFKAGQKKHKIAFSSLINNQSYTVDNLLSIQSKKHNRHFDILGCYQGAVIQDIERNAEKFEVGTTFTVHAPAQYSTSSVRGNPILLDQLKQYSIGEADQARLFGRYSKRTAETLFFIKIVKGVDGKNTLIAFKAIAPKHAENAKALEEFMNRETAYQLGSKDHQNGNLVTLAGADHPDYHSLHDTIVKERSATPLSTDYLHQTLEIHKRRDRARKENADKKEKYTKNNNNKEPLAETLLQKYQDIPDIVAKNYDSIPLVKDEFLNHPKGWVRHYSGIVDYAMVHNQTIDGKHPLIWAIENNIKIEEKHPLPWAIENDKMIGNESALEWAIRIGQKIGDKSALEFAMKQNKTIGDKLAIEWALEHDIKIGEQPVLEWAIYNQIKVGELSAVEYAVLHDATISGQSALDWLIDHYRGKAFSEDVTSRTHVLEYIKDGDRYRKEVLAPYSIAEMVEEPWQKADTVEGATIDGVNIQDWSENYRKLFTRHIIFDQTPVEYAIQHDKKIKGFETVGIPQVYDIEAIESAIEKDNPSELKAALEIDPNTRDKFGYSPLAYARAMKKPGSIRALLALGVNPALKDAHGRTEISIAVDMGTVEIVKALLESSHLEDLNDADGTELLCGAKNAEIVELLLQHKADPNRGRLENGFTPLKIAILNDNLPVICVLLKGGARPDDPDAYGVVLLHRSVSLGKADVVEALLKGGANPHEAKRHRRDDETLKTLAIEAKTNSESSHLPANYFRDDNIEFPICLAARSRNAKIISLLADKAVNLNQWNVDGKTPLSIALGTINSSSNEKELNAAFEVVKILLERDVDPNVLNKDGSSPLSILRFTGYNNEHAKKIKNAALDLLIVSHVDLNVVGENGRTLLQSAVMDSNLMLVEKLLAGKAEPNIQDEVGRSALFLALSMYKNPKINSYSYESAIENANRNIIRMVELLITHGAAPNVQDKAGVSPLQMSVSFDDPTLMNKLFEAKADPNTQDKEGNSPLSCLVERAIAQVKQHDHYRLKVEIDRLKAFLENPSTDPNLLSKTGVSQIESVLDHKLQSKSVYFESFADNKQQLVKTLIEAPHLDANLLNKQGVRLLSTVINKGDYGSVALLLKKADPNLPDTDGTTPLQHAIRRNNPELVELLLNSGANPMAPGKEGVLPIAEARALWSSHNNQSFARYNSADIIKMLEQKTLLPYQKAKKIQTDDNLGAQVTIHPKGPTTV